MSNVGIARAIAWTLLCAAPIAGATPAAAQGTIAAEPGDTLPELVRSIGQPRTWHPFATGTLGRDHTRNASLLPGASLGIERPIGNPVGGALSVGGEGYIRSSHGTRDAGIRVLARSPLFLGGAGADWNLKRGSVDLLLGATLPVRRGGWPLPGSQVRAQWIPARRHFTEVGIVVPLGQPLAGRTRPRRVVVRLPATPGFSPRPAQMSEGVQAAWSEARTGMTQLVSMLTFFWLIEDRNLSYAASVHEWRELLADFSAEFFPGAGRRLGVSQYGREAESYHSALERAFALSATGPETLPDAGIGRLLADTARRVALMTVLIPYNSTYGRVRSPNSLVGLSAAARVRFGAWLETRSDLSTESQQQALALFGLWLVELDRLRGRIDAIAKDRRVTWMPLGLVLRPEDHRTQAQIDEIASLAAGRSFETGNTAFTIDAAQFPAELVRTLRQARSSHVLWVHDYRGVDDLGAPDHSSFITTLAYLRALRDAVQEYDSTRRIPAYVILVDQHFWEVTRGRLWMTLLERPLAHRLRLEPRFVAMQTAIEAMQDSLRSAVAASERLQEESRLRGRGWIPGLVKIHVNITNPADFTFRTRHILAPIGTDNMLRDHRKMILRDADESDPASGEVVFAGVGVGNHYASATWDDRAIIVRGPAVAATLSYLRATLERHRLKGTSLPAVFRTKGDASPEAAASRIRALEQSGATARVMQTHNDVGWGTKESSFMQMLLYDLAPEGTVIVVPDALWSSYQWMAQLVGAALRGCRVFIIAPARANAPADGFPWMSVQQELITRTALVEEVLGDAIRAGGGDLRIGLYARTTPLADYAASLDAVVDAWSSHGFLRTTFPLAPSALEVLKLAAARERRAPSDARFAPDARDRMPLLHRKTQWIIGSGALLQVTGSPDFATALAASLEVPRFGASASTGSDDALRMAAMNALLRIHAGIVDQEAPLYFATGSINKNPRSMTIDGEVLGIVAGPWSLESMLDLLILLGTTTWTQSVSDVEQLLPPYSRHRRRLGRVLHPII